MTLILPLIAVVAGNPVFVQSVEAGSEAGSYVMHIEGESPIDPEQVSGRSEGRRLTVYVSGARVRSENRAWGEGEGRVKAYRHRERLELEGRLPSDECAQKVHVASGGNGSVIARVSCAASAQPTAATNATQAAVSHAEAAAVRTTQSNIAQAPPKPVDNALLAAVALPPVPAPALELPAALPAAEPTAAAPQPALAAAPAAAPVAAPAANTTPSGESKVSGQAAASPASLWGTALKALLPVLLLGAVALVGLKFTRKRRQLGRLVQIVETTPLGPKRSLIVARLGRETLLLGASEAGIALIHVRSNEGEEPAELEQPTKRQEREDHDGPEVWVDSMSPELAGAADAAEAGQVKLLSRLFRKRRQDIPEAWPFANVLDASLADDSIEDRELREKLAHGLEAQVR